MNYNTGGGNLQHIMYIEDAPRFGRISGKSAALTASIYFLRFCNFSKIGSIFH